MAKKRRSATDEGKHTVVRTQSTPDRSCAEETASGIPVHFGGWENVRVEDLKSYPGNARAHGDEQVALIAKSVRHQGWRWPIIVSRRSGYIVAGHGRLKAARLLKVATVPVVYQDFPDARSEEAFRLADNRLPELAEQQTAIIKDLIEELNDGQFDTDLTGYTSDVIELMMTSDTPMKPLDVKPPPRMAWVLVGVPIGDWAKVAPMAESAACIEGSIVETTINDGIKED